jgi:hypothetical protein
MVDTIPKDVFSVFSEGPDVNDGLLDVERWTAMLRDVAFQSAPKTPKTSSDLLLRIDRRDKRNWR